MTSPTTPASDFVRPDQRAALSHHANWLNDAVFYEIYPQSFADSNGDGIGDIPGIIDHLDYISSLGFTALWINPCFSSPFQDAGYDVDDFMKVAPRYGTNDDLVRLFDEAHRRNIKVLLDLVPGHTSLNHPWFKASQNPDPAARGEFSERYIWTGSAFENGDGMPFISGTTQRDGAYIVNFFAFQPALNYGYRNPSKPWQKDINDDAPTATREAMREVMRFWLSKGADGFRVDMADSLVKNDDNEKSQTVESWRRMLAPIKSEFPEAAFVSEWSRPWQSLKAGFDMDFYLDWGWVPNGYNILLRRASDQLDHNNDLSYFNADSGRSPLEFLADYQPQYENTKDLGFFSFITCNHDSPRLAPRLSERERRVALAFLLLMPGVPFVYYGDEIGMNFRKLVSKEGGFARTGSRTPMQWDRTDNLGFSSAPADQLYLPVDPSEDAPTVAEQIDDEDSLLSYVKQIIFLRHSHSALKAASDMQIVFAQEGYRSLAVLREDGTQRMLLVVNPGRDTEQFELQGVELGDMSHVTALVGSGICDEESSSVRISGQSALLISF